MSAEKPNPQKTDLPVDPKRGDAIMRQAFKMSPKPNKQIKPKRRGKRRAKDDAR